MRRLARIAALLALVGCYEIPPVIPPGYIGSPAAPGWPPLAVYDADPFHPKNRWFHRAFSGRGPAGEILPAHADEPFGLIRKPSAVDAAEWLAILSRIENAEPVRSACASREVISAAIFRSDLHAQASRLRAECPDDARVCEVESALLRLSREGDDISNFAAAMPSEMSPPPLRSGEWVEVPPPAAPGLVPSPFDPRGARLLREKNSGLRSVLLRLRAASDRNGASVLLPIASECWEIDRGRGDESCRVWRFDRAEWLQGREAWRELAEESEITIRSPADPAMLLTGNVSRLCSSCHCDGRVPGGN